MSAELKPAEPAREEARRESAVADVYDDGRLRVEHDNYFAAFDGQSFRFPRTEFLLLSRLVRNAARVVTAEELWRSVWGGSKPYNPESLHVHIYRLRTKLAPFGVRIESMVNVGYRFVGCPTQPRAGTTGPAEF